MALTMRDGNLPHTKWIALTGTGVLTECAVFKIDGFGNVNYLEITKLDRIDKARLAKILMSRNAETFELWDLMSQVTLKNGINALEYFHQLVKVITPDGIVMNPMEGVVGTGIVNTESKEDMASIALNNIAVESVAVDSPAATPAEKRAATMAAKKDLK